MKGKKITLALASYVFFALATCLFAFINTTIANIFFGCLLLLVIIFSLLDKTKSVKQLRRKLILIFLAFIEVGTMILNYFCTQLGINNNRLNLTALIITFTTIITYFGCTMFPTMYFYLKKHKDTKMRISLCLITAFLFIDYMIAIIILLMAKFKGNL